MLNRYGNEAFQPRSGSSGQTNSPTIFFSIPLEPVAKGRPRISTRNGRVFAYTPGRTRDYEKVVALIARRYCKEPLTGPVRVDLAFGLKPPKKAPQWCLKRPDLDNLMKIIDALNGIAWLDDKQVVEAHLTKFYRDPPQTEVRITAL